MRLLLDKNLSFRLAGILAVGGHDVVHVDDLDLEHAADDVILTGPASWTGSWCRRTPTSVRSWLRSVRAGRRWCSPARSGPTRRARSPSCCLLAVAADVLEEGAIVVVGRQDVRVRRLPLR